MNFELGFLVGNIWILLNQNEKICHVVYHSHIGTSIYDQGDLVCGSETRLAIQQASEDRVTITNPINTRGNQANFGTQHNYAGANIQVTPVVLGNGTSGNNESEFAGKKDFSVYCGRSAMEGQISKLHQ